MKKVAGILFLCLLPLLSPAQVQPEFVGTFKTHSVGGPTDIFVKLQYTTEQNFFAFYMREMHYNSYFPIILGQNKEEALTSLDNLLAVLVKGKKDEVYRVDDRTLLKKINGLRMNVYRNGQWDAGYIQKRHIKNAIHFISNLE